MSARTLLVVVLAITLVVLQPWSRARLVDFGAFYCGARVLAAGADPSRIEPLRSCETKLPAALPGTHGFVVPVPLPPIVIAAFEPLTKLSYRVAYALWFTTILAVGLGALVALQRLARLPSRLVVPLAIVPLAIVPLEVGQVSIFAVAALYLAALAARHARDRLAGLFVLVAFAQPQLALGAALALPYARPRSRSVLGVGMAATALLTFAMVGTARTVAFVSIDLPSLARAEYGRYMQYSLTALFAALRVPQSLGLALGTFATLGALVGGMLLGRRIAALEDDGAYLVAVPAAFAVAFGTHVHAHQIAAALPAAFLLAARQSAAAKRRWIAPMLLAVPLVSAINFPLLYIPIASAVAFAVARALGASPGRAAVWAAMPLLLVVLSLEIPTRGLGPIGPRPLPLPPNDSAIALWAAYNDWTDPAPNLWALAWKLPTWLGLGIVVRQAWVAAAVGRVRSPQATLVRSTS